MKKLKLTLLILCAVSFVGHLFLYPHLPDMIPSNWSFDGTINSYSEKSLSIFLALLPALLLLLMDFIPRIDPRGRNYQKHEKAYQFFMIAIVLFLTVMVWVSNLAALGYTVDMGLLVQLGLGILFLIIGNFMPQIRSNYTFGIKTPWAIENEYVWRKTHQAGGIVFCLLGILFLISAFFKSEIFSWVIMGFLLISTLGLSLYSYLVYRKLGAQPGEQSAKQKETPDEE